MAQMDYSWKIANYVFHLVSDDIFNLGVEAIVNSEQTDFILARNQSSIAGQILSRFGYAVQRELDSKTGGLTQELGKIITTDGGSGIKIIYHAGFHDPMIFLSPDKDSDQTEHLKIIRKCYRDILDDFFSSSLNSIAFPLLGTGLFQLDRRLVANEFFDQLLSISNKYSTVSGKHIWLVDRDHRSAEIVLQTIVQRLIDLAIQTYPAIHIHFDLGINFIDRFEAKFTGAADSNWLLWLLVRYYELIIDYIFIVLACANTPSLLPEEIFEPGKPISFGTYRSALIKVAHDPRFVVVPESWAMCVANKIIKNPLAEEIMARINQDRNSIAHGRKHRELEDIFHDILSFITIIDWKDSLSRYSHPPLNTLVPWVYVERRTNSSNNGTEIDVGILDKWKSGQYEYLIPHSGEVLHISK